MIRNLFIFSFFLFLSIASCRKKEDPAVVNPPTNNGDSTMGKLTITIQNVAGSQPLILDNAWYVTESGDSLQVNEYKYYISNIILSTDTSEFREWESYYLIDERNSVSKVLTIDSIPKGMYHKVTFLIGVDVRRNTMGAQTGALDVAHGMFWDWNSGYIMAKLEGTSPQISAGTGSLSYHIAGFRGANSVIKTVTLDFPQTININSEVTKNIHIKADLLEWFKDPEIIHLAWMPIVGSEGPEAVKISNNYADMFKIDHID